MAEYEHRCARNWLGEAMGIFRRSATKQQGQAADDLGVLILGGYDDLEVVGESFHQEELWFLVGGRRRDPSERICHSVIAVLTPEPDNPHDGNAIAVSINGLKVGHLSRDDARLYLPGLLAWQQRDGRAVALHGEIVGGGIRDDGRLGMLGVFLDVNPQDFGVQRPTVEVKEPRIRTGLSEALAGSSAGSSDELTRLSALPKTDVAAIAELRKLLARETNPVRRHFAYAEIEGRLYRCRDVFSSALQEFDQCCQHHDAEMDGICQALMVELGAIPLLELYRQMAIRKHKIHDYQAALRWAQRGIALYSGRAATPEGITDLRRRAATYRAKLPSMPPRQAAGS